MAGQQFDNGAGLIFHRVVESRGRQNVGIDASVSEEPENIAQRVDDIGVLRVFDSVLAVLVDVSERGYIHRLLQGFDGNGRPLRCLQDCERKECWVHLFESDSVESVADRCGVVHRNLSFVGQEMTCIVASSPPVYLGFGN